jgi:hypothetical protein
MAAKSLIAFKKQPLQQLGIDPAFEEAGSGTSCLPAMNSANEEVCLVLTGTGAASRGRSRATERSNNLRIVRDVQTNLQSEI